MMPRILIVEDHRDFRQAVVHFLELNKVKAQMMEACSGEEGVLIARKVKPRVVIMDFCLGGINGIEAARQIKKHDPKCNIIMLTMFDAKEIAQVKRNRVIKAFIGKSELFDQLIPAIDKALYN
jgi:DNA-binding NarL/FixJ family response regulator